MCRRLRISKIDAQPITHFAAIGTRAQCCAYRIGEWQTLLNYAFENSSARSGLAMPMRCGVVGKQRAQGNDGAHTRARTHQID